MAGGGRLAGYIGVLVGAAAGGGGGGWGEAAAGAVLEEEDGGVGSGRGGGHGVRAGVGEAHAHSSGGEGGGLWVEGGIARGLDQGLLADEIDRRADGEKDTGALGEEVGALGALGLDHPLLASCGGALQRMCEALSHTLDGRELYGVTFDVYELVLAIRLICSNADNRRILTVEHGPALLLRVAQEHMDEAHTLGETLETLCTLAADDPPTAAWLCAQVCRSLSQKSLVRLAGTWSLRR